MAVSSPSFSAQVAVVRDTVRKQHQGFQHLHRPISNCFEILQPAKYKKMSNWSPRIYHTHIPFLRPARPIPHSVTLSQDLHHGSSQPIAHRSPIPTQQTWDSHWQLHRSQSAPARALAVTASVEERWIIREDESVDDWKKSYANLSTGPFRPSPTSRTSENRLQSLSEELGSLSIQPDGAESLAPRPIGPPCPNYTFHMKKPSDLGHHSSKQAELGQKAPYYSTSLYRGPNDSPVIVHYCRNYESAERIAQLFLNDDILGFDIEFSSRPSASSTARDAVSLVQVANERRVGLFHLAKFKTRPRDVESEGGEMQEDLIPPTLRRIIEDPRVYKTGVAVSGDMTRIRKWQGLKPRGVFELSHLHNLLNHVRNTPASYDGERIKTGLRLTALLEQCTEYLGHPLFKEESVRMSNWHEELDLQQIKYAADDAYASLRIFEAMDSRRLALKPTPARPLCVAQYPGVNEDRALAGGPLPATRSATSNAKIGAIGDDDDSDGGSGNGSSDCANEIQAPCYREQTGDSTYRPPTRTVGNSLPSPDWTPRSGLRSARFANQ